MFYNFEGLRSLFKAWSPSHFDPFEGFRPGKFVDVA